MQQFILYFLTFLPFGDIIIGSTLIDTQKGMKKMKKTVITILILTAAALFAYFYQNGTENIPDTVQNTPETVTSIIDSAEPEPSEDTVSTAETETKPAEQEEISYTFRNQELYDSHFEKHGAEFGNITKEEYLQKANELINSDSPDVLHKTEKEDGDYLFYNQKTNEFLVLSTDGYIRTYFKPDDGIDYWERQ